MAKLSAVNKNKKRIKLSDRLYKKRAALKKIVMDRKLHLKKDLRHNKNCQNYQETQQKPEL